MVASSASTLEPPVSIRQECSTLRSAARGLPSLWPPPPTARTVSLDHRCELIVALKQLRGLMSQEEEKWCELWLIKPLGGGHTNVAAGPHPRDAGVGLVPSLADYSEAAWNRWAVRTEPLQDDGATPGT